MRKIIFAVLCIISALLLTGCEIHFGNISYDVHWWVVLLINVPFVVFGFVITLSLVPKKAWIFCPNCKKRFQAKRWKYMFTYGEAFGDVIVKCPCCGKRSPCQISYDQEDK